MNKVLGILWRIILIIFIVHITSGGIFEILKPYRALTNASGNWISLVDYTALPVKAKSLAFASSCFKVLLGSWLLYRLRLRKDKIIGVSLIIICTLILLSLNFFVEVHSLG